MYVQSQYPTMLGCNPGVRGHANGSCRCTSRSRSSETDEYESPKSNFPISENSYSSPYVYDDWSVLDDDDQNTFNAFRKKACNFLTSDGEEAPTKAFPCQCTYGHESQYVCPSLWRKANDMIDYVPESEFLKKIKQQCQLLQSNQPNLFSAIEEGIVVDSSDAEKFIEEATEHMGEFPGPAWQSRTAMDGTFRQKCGSAILNEPYDQYSKTGRNDRPYLVEGNPSCQNISQSTNAQKKKSEHISRSKKPHKCRGRRKQRSSSGEAGECLIGDEFVPTLKRPHENSCDRCWRYASPTRSPVNKPEQKYDPNFRRAHSNYSFERGDADVDDSDTEHISPPRNLQAVPSSKQTLSLLPPSSLNQATQPLSFTQNIPAPGETGRTPPPNFVQRTPLDKSNSKSFSPSQRPSTAQTASEPVCQHRHSEMHPSFQQKTSERQPSPHPSFQQRTSERPPSPHPFFQQRTSERPPSPHPSFQQRTSERPPSPHPSFQQRTSERHPSPHQATQHECLAPQAARYPVIHQKGVQTSPQPVGQQRPHVQFRSSPGPAEINFYDTCPDLSLERTFYKCPVHDSHVDLNQPIIYSDQSWSRLRSAQATPEKPPDIPPVEVRRFSDNFGGLSTTGYQTIKPSDHSSDPCYSRSFPTAPRQPSPSGLASTGLRTIPEVGDINSSKTKSPKEQNNSSKGNKTKSPKNESRRSAGSPKRSSGSSRGNSPSNAHSTNKSGPPMKGKSKSPSPKPCPGKSHSGGGKSPKKSPKKSPEVDSKRTKSTTEVSNVQPRSPERRPQSSDPRSREPSPVKSPVRGPVVAPPEEYQRSGHPFRHCCCRPNPMISPDPNYRAGHLICCHCKWQDKTNQQDRRYSPSGAQNMNQAQRDRLSPEQYPKGYDSIAFRCPSLRKNRDGVENTSEPFGEAELRLMRDRRKEFHEKVSPIPQCSPRKYFVMYMTKSKENKADEDVEVLVEELTQTCPKKTDSTTKDITEKMRKIMECPSDSMALRFQKGVSEPCKVPQGSRILYF